MMCVWLSSSVRHKATPTAHVRIASGQITSPLSLHRGGYPRPRE